MEPKDIIAIVAFIIIFKMVTSPNLRGRAPKDSEPEPEAAEAPERIAPMHMPIQIPAGGPPTTPSVAEPEKLIIDGPIPDDSEPTD